MNKILKQLILKCTDLNEDGLIQWWELVLSFLLILLFWVGIVGAVMLAQWIAS